MITAQTQLYGLIGHPVRQSLSPAMYNALFTKFGIDAVYLAFDVRPSEADRVADMVRVMGLVGVNLTVPFKELVMTDLDECTTAASEAGAVNVVTQIEGVLMGYNTDGEGFVRSLEEENGPDPKGIHAVILGAGGAARAIGVECALAGAAHITVVNRSADRGNELVTLLNDKTPVTAVLESWDGDYTVPAGTDVVINATSIGLADAEAKLALDLDSLTAEMVVADVIPNPPRTQLVRDAEAKGCTVIDGLGMLVNQGITGIEYWTGETVDGNVMRARLEELFED